MMTGCVSSGNFTRGKRKGRPRYDGKPIQAVVTDAEANAEFARYERDTSKCGECMGTGQIVAGWHYQNGTTYRPCLHCHGNGVAPHAQQVSAA